MLEFLIDNIFVEFERAHFSTKGKNGAPFLVDLFLYSYEAWFIKKIIKDKTITEVKAFNLTCRYIDDVLSINNSLHDIAEILLKLKLIN